ncbi:MAG TPA: hypothetical protein VK766_12320, partial [Cytophagaceae bacterium]|nr:hypothetical protein [Cytophagaceae bacterium]
MNRKNQSILLLFLFFIPIGVIFIHYFYLRPSITEAYHETPDPFIKLITDTFYPRFSIEKKRFDLTFFLDKSDQVIYRFTFLYYLIFLLSYLTPKKASFQAKMHTLFYTKTNSKNVTILRVIFFSYLLYIGYHLCHDLLFMQPLKSFYKPILWLNILNIPFPNYISVILLGSIWCSFILLTIFNVRPVVFSAASFALFLLFQCWEFSFEKIDHGYVTFTYAFMLIPFLLEEQKNNNQPFNSWSLSLIKISIAMVYFLSSLEKIFISKLSWLDPENLKAYLYFHETDLSKIIVQHDFL